MSTASFQSFEMKENYEPGPSEVSAVPEVLKAYLSSIGQEAKWISARADYMPKYRMRGFSPLLYSTLPKDIQREARGIADAPERNHDELRLGDAILVVRSVGAGQYWEKAEKHRARIVLENTTLGDETLVVDEINARSRQAIGKSALIVEESEMSRRPASDHVKGGTSAAAQQEFTQEMRDELKRQREEIPD